jgi:hypothetical protein
MLGPQTNSAEGLIFTRNDPFDRTSPIQLVLPRLMESWKYMQSIREYEVVADAVAILL